MGRYGRCARVWPASTSHVATFLWRIGGGWGPHTLAKVNGDLTWPAGADTRSGRLKDLCGLMLESPCPRNTDLRRIYSLRDHYLILNIFLHIYSLKSDNSPRCRCICVYGSVCNFPSDGNQSHQSPVVPQDLV
ncbi:hypothetical protein AMTR_s00050p00226750 [Amborella trichopoda]|uniref:Uncharacterized protein n=1 Tax=Amborella trichopoda TaxID=13333 RepID=W1PSE6_AMBTC|nr:hypothetical protein AMTR_s00050p00226750 [Amborella trichopoda]